jgi:hypothetical protein
MVRIEPLRGRRSLHPRRPYDGAGRDLLLPDFEPLLTNVSDRSSGSDFDAEFSKRLFGLARQDRRESR